MRPAAPSTVMVSHFVRFLQGASASALCVAMAGAAHAQTAAAQSTPTADAQASATPDSANGGPDDIVVTGIRASLANAQNIKRNSDTVVDAITAQDIGALPDRSVTEALQRVPGVSISRFAASNDPDHFSVEGSGVVIRGLNFVRSEFNGRDAFSAGIGGQALNFSDVPAELLGSVEVFKNVTAAAIEGGLAGTVNLNTRKPFDNKGLHAGVDLEGSYGDLQKKWAPTGSILISDTWETGLGTFGLLGDVSYSRVRSRADGLQITNFQQRDNTLVTYQSQGGTTICRNPLPGNSDTTTLPASNAPCGAASSAGADGFADPTTGYYAPLGGQYRTQEFDRKRNGIAVAAQFESKDHSFLLTGQYIRSHTTNLSDEHTFEAAPDLSEYSTYPIGCQQNNAGPLTNPADPNSGTVRAQCPVGQFTNYKYDQNGLFQSGYITTPGTGYRSNLSGTPSQTFIPTGGAPISLSRGQVYEQTTVSDYGLNALIHPIERLHIALDADYTESRHQVSQLNIYGETFADQELNLTGNLPTVVAHKPATLAAGWAGPANPVLAGETDAQYFADPNVEFYRAAMDHFEDSRGKEFQFKADTTYDVDGGFLDKIRFGARYADRDQTVKYSAYNWGMLSEVWAGYPVSVAQVNGGNASFYDFNNFFRGATPGPSGAYYYNGNMIDGYNKAVGFINQVETAAAATQTANGGTPSTRWTPAALRAGVGANSPYLPNEVTRVHERDSSAYVMATFKTKTLIDGLDIAGNVGVRYVHTGMDNFGGSIIPSRATLGIADTYQSRCVPATPTNLPAGYTPAAPGGVCLLGAGGYARLQQFAAPDPTIVLGQAHNDYTYWLPSFNLKVGLTPQLLFRLAGSKVLTRPDTNLVRNFQQISIDGNGNFQSQVGNPYLKPARAWQFDATVEWYFSRVGSLTADVFYKDITGFFYQSLVSLPLTNNGQTFDLLTRGPANYQGHGKVKGAEIAYQQTFTFLPGLLSGFGFTGNYTFIQSSGLPNSFLNAGAPVTNVAAQTQTGSLPLEGLSKHNVNATLFYEKGPVSIRAAYNWRSKYLLTAADVIYPYTSIFQDAAGQLDASAFLSINKYVKIGVQGVNLNNSVTKTLQAYTGDPSKLAPRSYFVNDRRFSFILRGNF
ncbi:TonB-dependent receptor [Sphingomonas sp. PL20]|uniref:TonB-dependent receptor n=1 Tax=Sphingomonas sp. PL20 TaxID=2760712 RepID=UPI001AE97ABD